MRNLRPREEKGSPRVTQQEVREEGLAPARSPGSGPCPPPGAEVCVRRQAARQPRFSRWGAAQGSPQKRLSLGHYSVRPTGVLSLAFFGPMW